jgi:hypothetical protein
LGQLHCQAVLQVKVLLGPLLLLARAGCPVRLLLLRYLPVLAPEALLCWQGLQALLQLLSSSVSPPDRADRLQPARLQPLLLLLPQELHVLGHRAQQQLLLLLPRRLLLGRCHAAASAAGAAWPAQPAGASARWLGAAAVLPPLEWSLQ